MATLLHYFPFIEGAYTDVAGDITLVENGTGTISPLESGGLQRIYFETDDNGLDITTGANVSGDWSFAARVRIEASSAGKYPTVLTLDNLTMYFEVLGTSAWLYLDYANGTDTSLSQNAFAGNGEFTAFSSAIGREFLIVLNVSAASGLQLYVNNQKGWGNQDNTSFVPTLILGTSAEKHIGPRDEEFYDGGLSVADVAFFSGTLTSGERSALWNSGTGFPLVACTLESVSAGDLDSGVYNNLCDIESEDEEIDDTLQVTFVKSYALAVEPRDRLNALDVRKTFWQREATLTETIRTLLTVRPAFVTTLAEAATAGDTVSFLTKLNVLERVTAQDLRFGQYTVELVNALRATPTLRAFLTELVDEDIEADDDLSYEDALILLDALFAQIQINNRLTTTRTDFTNALGQFTAAISAEVLEAIEAEQAVSVSAALNLIDRMQAQTVRAAAFAVSRVDSLRARLVDRLALQGDLLDTVDIDTDFTFFDSIILKEVLVAQTERTVSFALQRLDSIRARLLSRVGISDVVTDGIEADVAFTSAYKLVLRDAATSVTPLQGAFSLNRTDTARARTVDRISVASLLLDSVTAGTEFTFLDVLRLHDVLGAQVGHEVVVTSSLVLALLARDFAQRAETQLTTEEILADQSFQTEVAKIMMLYEELQASVETSQTLTIMVNDTLHGQAGDSVQVLGQYLAQPWDTMGAWVAFRLGEEAATGWVMNTEGEMPLSEYENYDFNSFCKVGDVYLGARDEGLYLLDGDTDDGEPIQAAVRTMMLDFGSPVMKRVHNGYIGYTSTGRLMLKVRTVSGGELKEQWYEAKELQAQAPREQMIRLGRGLRSRYWQFELVNVDGSDFELMNLELHPVYLNRRV